MRMRSRLGARLFIKAYQVASLRHGLFGIEREPGIDFGRDATGDNLEDLQAEGDREAVHRLVDDRLGIGALGGVAGLLEGALDDAVVRAHLGRGGEQRRVGRRVAWFEFDDRLEVTGVGDDGRVGFELLEKALGHFRTFRIR